jgi:uncharacterized protein (DUF433 family)
MKNKLIQSDPSIMMGKPVIAGTRITVELILEKLAAGETIEQILEAHPRLTRKAVQHRRSSADPPSRALSGAESVSRAFHDHEAEFPQAFSVISPGRVRIRSKS